MEAVPKGILKTNHLKGRSEAVPSGNCGCCNEEFRGYWHPDHFDPFHFHVSHCHTANTQWRPSDRVALLKSQDKASPAKGRNPIALKSRNGTVSRPQTSPSSIDLFHQGAEAVSRTQEQRRRPPLGKKNGKTEAISVAKTTASQKAKKVQCFRKDSMQYKNDSI